MRKKRIRTEKPVPEAPSRIRKKRKPAPIIDLAPPISVRRKKRRPSPQLQNNPTSTMPTIVHTQNLKIWLDSNKKNLIDKANLKDKINYRQYALPVSLQIRYYVRPFYVGELHNKKDPPIITGIKDTSCEMSSGPGIIAHDQENPKDKVFMVFEDLNHILYNCIYLLSHIEYIYNQLQTVVRYETSGLLIQIADEKYSEIIDNPAIQFKL